MRNIWPEVPHQNATNQDIEDQGYCNLILQRLWPTIPEREQLADAPELKNRPKSQTSIVSGLRDGNSARPNR
jgi:hypothetical protein